MSALHPRPKRRAIDADPLATSAVSALKRGLLLLVALAAKSATSAESGVTSLATAPKVVATVEEEAMVEATEDSKTAGMVEHGRRLATPVVASVT